LSSCEVVVAGAPDALLAHVVGAAWEPRLANAHRTMAPHDVYPCRDGEWLALAVGDDEEWSSFCRALRRDDWAGAFPTAESRRAAANTLSDGITAWTKARPAREAVAVLQAAGVPSAPVMTFRDLAEDPHLADRGVFIDVEHPELGRQRVMRAPWVFSTGVSAAPRPGPLMGADNEAVLARLDGIPEFGERAAEVFR
jgi:crotonobetainyl-CoA:carnitine CoA-transferase CaiB-like acyl-CoA transferase